MAKRMKLVSEALFTKLMGTQPFEEAKIAKEQTNVLTNDDIPDDIKAILYRDYMRQIGHQRTFDENRPLYVTTKTGASTSATQTSSSADAETNTAVKTFEAASTSTDTAKPVPLIKNIDTQGIMTAKFLNLIGITWDFEYNIVMPRGFAPIQADVRNVIKALSHERYYNTLTPGMLEVTDWIKSGNHGVSPYGYLKANIIQKITGAHETQDESENESYKTPESRKTPEDTYRYRGGRGSPYVSPFDSLHGTKPSPRGRGRRTSQRGSGMQIRLLKTWKKF